MHVNTYTKEKVQATGNAKPGVKTFRETGHNCAFQQSEKAFH